MTIKLDIALATLLIPLSKSVPFFLVLFIGYRYGVSKYTDAIFIVLSVVNIGASIINGISDTSAIPAIHEARRKRCERAATIRYILGLLLRGIPLSLILVSTLHLIYGANATLLTLATLPLLHAVSSATFNILTTKGKYFQCVFPPYISLLAVALCDFKDQSGEISIVFIILLYEVIRALLYTLALLVSIIQITDEKPYESAIVSKAWKASYPLIIGSAAAALAPAVSLHFAESAGPAMATLMEYTNKLWSAFCLAFSGYFTFIFNHLSKNDKKNHAIEANRLARLSIYYSLPATLIGVLFAFYAIPILTPNIMTDTHKQALAGMVTFVLIGFPFYAAGMVYVKSISSRMNTWPLTITAVFALAIHYATSIILIEFFSTIGICLGLSIANLATFVLLRHFNNKLIANQE